MSAAKTVPQGKLLEQPERPTTVVKIQRKADGTIVQGCDVYIGRRNTMGGWDLKESKWHNKYIVPQWLKKSKINLKDQKEHVWLAHHCKTSQECVARFKAHLLTRKDLLAVLQNELRGKVLGCWCKKKGHELCHGDVLAELADADPSTISKLLKQ